MKEINLKWTDCAFGIDTDERLKLVMDIEYDGAKPPQELLIITAFNCLAFIANENGMDYKELYSMAFKHVNESGREQESE